MDDQRAEERRSNSLGLVAMGSVALPSACERHYPKCCSHHQGWDDAFSLLRKVANVVDGEVFWHAKEDAEMKALFVVEVERGRVL